MKNVNSNKCLDVQGGSSGNGVNVQQYNCNQSTAQHFHLEMSWMPLKYEGPIYKREYWNGTWNDTLEMKFYYTSRRLQFFQSLGNDIDFQYEVHRRGNFWDFLRCPKEYTHAESFGSVTEGSWIHSEETNLPSCWQGQGIDTSDEEFQWNVHSTKLTPNEWGSVKAYFKNNS